MTEQWYDNKELYEMIMGLKKQIGQLSAEIKTTTELLRTYNGLREKLGKCEQDIAAILAQRMGSKDMWGYVVGAFGIIVALISHFMR